MANLWNLHETKALEDAIASKPELFHRREWHEVAKLVPSKTEDQIKIRYGEIIQKEEEHDDDDEMIECGYPGGKYTQEELEEDINRILNGSICPPLTLKPPKEEDLEEALRERGYELIRTP